MTLGKSDKLVPVLLGAVGAADHDEAPVREAGPLEKVSEGEGACAVVIAWVLCLVIHVSHEKSFWSWRISVSASLSVKPSKMPGQREP